MGLESCMEELEGDTGFVVSCLSLSFFHTWVGDDGVLTRNYSYTVAKQELQRLWQGYIGLPLTPREWKLVWRGSAHGTDEL